MPDLAIDPAPFRPYAGTVRGALLWAFRRIIGVYFRSIEVVGATPLKTTSGRLFVANHVNALVDPLLVLTTARCPISPVAKSTLWKIPALRWLLYAVDAVPIVRRRDEPARRTGSNDGAFEKIAAWLAGGHNLLIFPEGTSHSEPHLLEVKSGAARMLARAKEHGGRGLTLQAVALEFDERHVFRSRCLMLYGPVREVDSFTEDGEDLVADLTAQLREDLSELLVEGTTWPERRQIARVAEMLANDTGDRSLARWNSVGREVATARHALRDGDEAVAAEVGAAVDRYYALLAREGLADAQLARGTIEQGSWASAVSLALLLPLALPGIVLYAVPYQVTRLAARRVAREADEISTYKLATGLLAHPLWAALLIGGGVALLPLSFGLGFAALTLVSPFAALAWLDRTPWWRRALRLRARASSVAELRKARTGVMKLVEQARGKLGLAS